MFMLQSGQLFAKQFFFKKLIFCLEERAGNAVDEVPLLPALMNEGSQDEDTMELKNDTFSGGADEGGRFV